MCCASNRGFYIIFNILTTFPHIACGEYSRFSIPPVKIKRVRWMWIDGKSFILSGRMRLFGSCIFILYIWLCWLFSTSCWRFCCCCCYFYAILYFLILYYLIYSLFLFRRTIFLPFLFLQFFVLFNSCHLSLLNGRMDNAGMGWIFI